MSATVLPFPAGGRPSSRMTPAQELDAIMLAQLPPGPARDVCQGIVTEVRRIRGGAPISPATVHAFPVRGRFAVKAPRPFPRDAYFALVERLPPGEARDLWTSIGGKLARIEAERGGAS